MHGSARICIVLAALLLTSPSAGDPFVYTLSGSESTLHIGPGSAITLRLGAPFLELVLPLESQVGRRAGVSGGVLADGSTSDGHRANLSGTLLADVTPFGLEIRTPRTLLLATESGSWLAGLPADPNAPAPGQLAVAFSDPLLGIEGSASFREVSFTLRLFGALTDQGGGVRSFDSAFETFKFAAGALDWNLGFPSTFPAENGRAYLDTNLEHFGMGDGTVEDLGGGQLRITLPIDIDVVVPEVEIGSPVPASVQMNLTGQLVAYRAPVSECPATPAAGCVDAGKASLSISEKKAGGEKLTLKLMKLDGALVQSDFGDPVTDSTRVDACIYDDGDTLVAGLAVDRAGDNCGSKAKPCWKAVSDKGYRYKDPDAAASGVKKILAKGGNPGKGKLQLQAANKLKKGQTALPTGIAAKLLGAPWATVRVTASGGGCFGATLGTVKKNDGVLFKAKAP